MRSERRRPTSRTPVVRRGRIGGACGALLLVAGQALAAGDGATTERARIHGVKLYLNQDDLQARYPDDDRLVRELRAAGANAVFTTAYEGRTAFYASRVLPARSQAIDVAKLRRSARAGHLLFGAICHVFFDADTLAARPDLAPVDQNGDSRFVNWQTLVCPSDAAYRAYKLDVVREVAERLRPDVLSLDFMRFPTTWELIPASADSRALRNFCFCERCLGAFAGASGVVVPPALDTTPKKAAWILREHGREFQRWKTGTITSFVAQASAAVRQIDPDIRISLHVVPWAEDVFDGGLGRIAGQDVAGLAPYVDYLSPMIYHKLIGRPVEYVRSLTAELARVSGRAILPSIQAAQIEAEGELSGDEFGTALAGALASPSAGVLVYEWKELMPDAKAPPLHRQKGRIFEQAAPAAEPSRLPAQVKPRRE
jgi:hypothetical protein